MREILRTTQFEKEARAVRWNKFSATTSLLQVIVAQRTNIRSFSADRPISVRCLKRNSNQYLSVRLQRIRFRLSTVAVCGGRRAVCVIWNIFQCAPMCTVGVFGCHALHLCLYFIYLYCIIIDGLLNFLILQNVRAPSLNRELSHFI